ncbi:hypothetical protein O181_007822 [Austropuccinia psidii MF-1]|uniref:Uncharacterized protein n=1 Tax=Austropuccinia psidii MF-1 TaxID=1389203 RepID=A0A9Q3BNK2_9BASI|nr:hypothetical protein [Austropuccinia psidii MF-1]
MPSSCSAYSKFPEAPIPDGTSGSFNCKCHIIPELIDTDISDLATGFKKRTVEGWTNVGGAIPIGGRPIYSGSQVSISGKNNQGIVKLIRIIFNFPNDPEIELSDELDCEEAEVVNQSSGKPPNFSLTHPSTKKIKINLQGFQPNQPLVPDYPQILPPLGHHHPFHLPDNYKYWKEPPPNSKDWTGLLYHFHLPRYSKEWIVGQSGLPDRIQMPRVRLKILFPCSPGG